MATRRTRLDWRCAGFIAALSLAVTGVGLACTTDFEGPGVGVCGDGACADSEDAGGCPEDCPAFCGDGFCTHAEDPADCFQDCFAICGDGACAGIETAAMCPQDCPSVCGDGACTHAEDINDCAQDCVDDCGDGICANGEGPVSCATDCPAVCGDGHVTHTEGCDDGNVVEGDGCGADCEWENEAMACDNGIDDDGDGFVDCDDFDCTTAPTCSSGVSCSSVWICVQTCGVDSACISTCENMACSSAALVYDNLQSCIEVMCGSECSSGPGATTCQTCLEANCTAQLDACLLNTCS